MTAEKKLELIRMSEIKLQQVQWLWFSYIPFGKITIIQGDPGEGMEELLLMKSMIYCPDCGAKLYFCAAKSLRRNQEFFRCSNYKDGKRSKCTIHFIRDVVLEKIVLEAVSDLADFVRIYEPVFLYLIARREQDNRTGNLKELKDNLEAWKKRMKAIDKAISTLFEANMEGKIFDDRFMKMTADYESEQKELKSMVSKAEKDLKEAEQNKVDLRLLLKALREYSEIKELDPGSRKQADPANRGSQKR